MISNLLSATDVFYKTKIKTVKPVRKSTNNFFTLTFSVLNRPERKQFALLILADIFISVVDILSIALLLWIVQFYMQPDKNHLPGFLPEWILNKNSVALISLFFMVFTAKNLAAFLLSRVQYKFIGAVAVRISKNNLENYQASTFSDFVQVDSSVHLRKIAYQPYDFCQYLLSGVQQIITQSSLIVFTIAAVILFNAKLFLLLLLILLPPVVAVFYYIKKRLTKAKWHIKKGNEKSFQYLMDALKGYVEGNIYARNDFFLKRFVAQRKQFSLHLFDSMSIQTLPSRLIEIFAVMGFFILIVIAKWSGSNDSQSLLTLGAFMAAAYKIIPGVVKIVNTTSQIKAYGFSLDELTQSEIKSATINSTFVNELHSLKFHNIDFAYNGVPVLKNFSLDIQKGDFVGISGKSGAGKTTLLHLFLGFLQPSSGTIFINDRPVDSDELRNYWPQISYVRQQPFFIHDSIEKNITLEEICTDELRLKDVLEKAGLEELLNNSRDSANKIINENGKNISGGQQQRISLARALYKNAALILLDEPFNELDEKSELMLLQHFKQLTREGKTVLMVTHNQKALSFCDKIIAVDES